MANNRHAYLILVHNQPRLLQVLVDMIDDERNDIFIHVDKKTDIALFSSICSKKSNLIFTNRVKIYWGDVSMVEAELILFETARKQGPYLYYHLLSGVDLPLKSQDYIHNLFDKTFRGDEFVGFVKSQKIDSKVRYYYVFDWFFKNYTFIGRICYIIRRLSIKLQKAIGVWRNKHITFYKGAQWVSITDELCSYILKNKKGIFRLYRHTLCPDEIFIQTLLHESSLYHRVHNPQDEYGSCLRLIDWERGNNSSPYQWKNEDYSRLVSSDMLFARKFSEDDMDFVNRIKSHVLGDSDLQ